MIKHSIKLLADMSTKAAAKNKICDFNLVDELHCQDSCYKLFILPA